MAEGVAAGGEQRLGLGAAQPGFHHGQPRLLVERHQRVQAARVERHQSREGARVPAQPTDDRRPAAERHDRDAAFAAERQDGEHLVVGGGRHHGIGRADHAA